MLYSLQNQLPTKIRQLGCENFLQVSEVSETRERALLKEQKPCHQQCYGTFRGIATHGIHQQAILSGAKKTMTLQ